MHALFFLFYNWNKNKTKELIDINILLIKSRKNFKVDAFTMLKKQKKVQSEYIDQSANNLVSDSVVFIFQSADLIQHQKSLKSFKRRNQILVKEKLKNDYYNK